MAINENADILVEIRRSSPNPKDKLGDKPRIKVDESQLQPSKRHHEVRSSMVTKKLQRALAELEIARKMSSSNDVDLQRFFHEVNSKISARISKLSGGPVITLEEIIHG